MFPRSYCRQRQPHRLLTFVGGGLLGLVVLVTSAMAHEGHDDADADKAAPIMSAFPRVIARSDLYEIVGILRDGQLSITIDDATTNAPIADAVLQVTIGDAPAIAATSIGGGAYRVARPDPSQATSVDVIFAVTAKTGDDLLVDIISQPAPAHTDQPGSIFPAFQVAAGLLLLAVILGMEIGRAHV